MVICSTIEAEYVQDLTLAMFMDRFQVTDRQKQQMQGILDNASGKATSYKDPNGEGRICVTIIPDTQWKVAIIVPAASFNGIVGENTKDSVIAIAIVSLILISYAAHVLLRNVRRRREIAAENAKLEEENRIFDEENRRAFAEISEIRDIIASANMGTWRIELVEGEEPRMFVDETMKGLLGIIGEERTPEKTYTDWFSNIKPEAVPSVLKSVELMEQGYFDENTYLWVHPTKGLRYVRCGGTSQKIEGGFLLRGYHYDVDEVVRKEQQQMIELQEALDAKNEYYSTLGTLGDVFYSMHVVNLLEDTSVEFNARNEVKAIVNHRDGASLMMKEVMSAVTAEEYKEEALTFTDLNTIADRMKNRKIVSKQFIGRRIGWFLASFITMEADEEGYPTKLIFTTRSIDEEKKQEEMLIRKSQTDELTGLLNRRAYEEDIYEHNDVPEDKFIYISLDVNGLKVVNDTNGHMAGDEFVAILFCDVQKVREILIDFDKTIANWSGELVDRLSISYGWISREEKPEYSVRQLGAVAEQRMYESKDAHYMKTGVDRKGQQAAHKALCELYTKILKINISEDSYQIVNMDVNEQTEEKGFSDKISEWLKSFATTGHVHPDDLQEYLKVTDLQYMKNYFAEKKTSLHIFYRRKYENEFKQVMMEIIPANDYKEENQSLFLYVKSIDK